MRWRLKGDARGKYGAQRATCRAGEGHASKAEAARCDELHVLQAAGVIRDLWAHPQRRYVLQVRGVLIGSYVADFCYVEVGDQRTVVEDTKGYSTREYEMKRRLMRACWGVDVREVRPRGKGTAWR